MTWFFNFFLFSEDPNPDTSAMDVSHIWIPNQSTHILLKIFKLSTNMALFPVYIKLFFVNMIFCDLFSVISWIWHPDFVSFNNLCYFAGELSETRNITENRRLWPKASRPICVKYAFSGMGCFRLISRKVCIVPLLSWSMLVLYFKNHVISIGIIGLFMFFSVK